MTYVADHVQASKSGRAEHNSWWRRATTEQRLAQLDGGIECGLAASQVALASGATLKMVKDMAYRHGRKFGLTNRGSTPSSQRRHSVSRDRSAYLRGERVDLWGSEQRQDEFALDEVEA